MERGYIYIFKPKALSYIIIVRRTIFAEIYLYTRTFSICEQNHTIPDNNTDRSILNLGAFEHFNLLLPQVKVYSKKYEILLLLCHHSCTSVYTIHSKYKYYKKKREVHDIYIYIYNILILYISMII